ncbi:MAG: MFS transporter [Burkholderiales bacterium]
MTTPSETLRRDTRIIALVGIAHATSHFFHLVLPPLFPWLKVDFGLSYAELGLLMSVFFIVSGTGQAAAGFVVDRIGAAPVLFAGVGLCALSALVLAAAPNYAVLLIGAGIAGLGNCVFHPADFTLLGQRVSASRVSHAFSMHGISGNLGWAAAPVFLAGIAAAWSWRAALLGASLVAIAVLLTLISRRALLMASPSHASPDRTAAAHAAPATPLAFIRLPGVWMCFGFFFITAMALGGIQSFAPAALHELYGTPIALAGTGITVYMIMSALGMVVGGFVAARSSHHERTIAIAFLIGGAAAVLVGLGFAPGGIFWVMLSVMGFTVGIAGPSRDLLVRAAAPRNATGRVFGVVYSGLDIGLSIAPLIFGALMDAHRPGWIFVIVGLLQTAALLTAIGVGKRAARQMAIA